MTEKKRKKKRSSIYDPYLDEIKTWCDAGVSVKEMISRIGPGYTMQGLYQYIKTNGLRYSRNHNIYAARNKCDSCEYCREYINTNNTTGRICTKSWRSIQPLVRYSPEWCERNRGNDGEREATSNREREAQSAKCV